MVVAKATPMAVAASLLRLLNAYHAKVWVFFICNPPGAIDTAV